MRECKSRLPDLPRYMTWLMVTITTSLQQRIVDWVLTLGFEQELYRDEELASLYRYKNLICQYLHENAIKTLEVGQYQQTPRTRKAGISKAATIKTREHMELLRQLVTSSLSSVRLKNIPVAPMTKTSG